MVPIMSTSEKRTTRMKVILIQGLYCSHVLIYPWYLNFFTQSIPPGRSWMKLNPYDW